MSAVSSSPTGRSSCNSRGGGSGSSSAMWRSEILVGTTVIFAKDYSEFRRVRKSNEAELLRRGDTQAQPQPRETIDRNERNANPNPRPTKTRRREEDSLIKANEMSSPGRASGRYLE